MKRILFTLAVCFLLGSVLRAADVPAVQSYSSIQAPRVLNTTGLIDYWQLGNGAKFNAKLLSLFGYNSGSAGFINIFNTSHTNPVFSITGFDNVNQWYTNVPANILATGDAIQLTNTLGGNAAAIYWVSQLTSNTFFLNSTRAASLNFNADKGPSGSSASTFANLVPVHSFKVAATDNYSCIVPTTGIPFGRGIMIATSTTAGTWTVGGTNITAWLTIGSP